MMATVIMEPDLVVSVMYHVIANCTSAEPNNDIPWLARNSAAVRFQPGCIRPAHRRSLRSHDADKATKLALHRRG